MAILCRTIVHKIFISDTLAFIGPRIIIMLQSDELSYRLGITPEYLPLCSETKFSPLYTRD